MFGASPVNQKLNTILTNSKKINIFEEWIKMHYSASKCVAMSFF